MNIAEKILSRVAGKEVSPGDRIDAIPDAILTHEMLGLVTMPKFAETGAKKINPVIRDRIMCILDHGGIGTTPKYVEIHQEMRKFCREQGIRLFDVGTGVCHVVFHEKAAEGGVQPGFLVLGTDSHTTTHGAFNAFSKGIGGTDLVELFVRGKTWLEVPETIHIKFNGNRQQGVYAKDLILEIIGKLGVSYATDKALEFSNVKNINIAGRATIANMGVEMGAVAAIFPFDVVVEEYYHSLGLTKVTGVNSDENTSYYETYTHDATQTVPMVAIPHSPGNVQPVSEVSEKLDQVYIGSCTNSRLDDLRIAAEILKNGSVKVLTLISPGSHEIFLEAEKLGLVKVFLEAGCRILYPGCHACFGGPVGLIGEGMTVLSTSNRNFLGRMGGGNTARIFIASPATAAASALEGEIRDPRM